MRTKLCFKFLCWLVLAGLTLGPIQPGLAAAANKPETSRPAQPETSAPALPDTSAPALPDITPPAPPDSLKPYSVTTLNSAQECGVPNVMAPGQDLEPMVTGPSTQVYKLEVPFQWKMGLSNTVYISETKKTVKSQVDSPVGGATLGANKAVAVWKQPGTHSEGYENQLMAQFWNEETGFTTTDLNGENFDPNLPLPNMLTPAAGAAPVVVAPTENEFYVFTRASSGGIYYKIYAEGGFGEWFELPMPEPITGTNGTLYYYQAISDPVVVVQNSYQLLAFFLVANELTPDTYELYFNLGGHGTWLPRPISLGLPAGTTLTNARPVAVAPNNARAAVFVQARTASNTYAIYAKAWSIDDNATDWSDTTFVQVANGVKDTAPFNAGARWMNHMALAYQSSDLKLYIKEWNPANGWGNALHSLTLTNTPSSISLLSPFPNEMMIIVEAPSPGNTLNSLKFNIQKNGVWGTWSTAADNTVSGGHLALVQTSHSVLVLGKYYSWRTGAVEVWDRNKPYFNQYTNRDSSATVTPAMNLSANADPDGQRIVTVDGKTYWLNVYPASGTWKVEVRDPQTWKGTAINLNHGDPVHRDAFRFSLAVADMDLDGRDEPVIATMNHAQTTVDISWLVLTPTNNADTVMAIKANKLTSLTGSYGKGVSVTVGDLDGGPNPTALANTKADGKRNEVFISTVLSGGKTFRVHYYQFVPGTSIGAGTLVSKRLHAAYSVDLSPKLKTTVFESLGSVTGRFEPGQQTASTPADELVFLVGREGALADSELNKYTLRADANGIRYLSYQKSIPQNNLGASPALATADVDADRVDELIVAGHSLFVIPMDNDSMPAKMSDGQASPSYVGPKRLAVGDIDQDGRQEIIMVRSSATYGEDGYIFKAAAGQNLMQLAKFVKTGYTPLVADLDSDSMTATFNTLNGCQTYTNARTVHGVIYTPPVFYNTAKTAALQSYSASFAQAVQGGSSTQRGWKVNWGGSIGLGFEAEVTLPFVGKIGEWQILFTASVMAQVGGAHKESKSLEMGTGWSSSDVSDEYGSSNTRGMVIYTSRSYTCYNYVLRDPQPPNTEYPMEVCTAPTTLEMNAVPIEFWYDAVNGFNKPTEMGWMALDSNGAPSVTIPPLNDVDDPKYEARGSAPVPAEQILIKSPSDVDILKVGSTLSPNWWFGSKEGKDQVKKGSIDFNLCLSVQQVNTGFLKTASLTVGGGHDWENTQSWEETSTYAGALANVPTNCSYCEGYSLTPYVYTAIGTNNGGREYPYLVQDYFVNARPTMPRAEDSAAGSPALGAPLAAPQAPVVTSATHPDPNAWYGSAPAFSWSQPAGDSTSLRGYRWIVTQNPADSPQYVHTTLASQDSYTDVPDGLYYFHIQAVGTDGSLSPVTHRAFRVDTTAPTPVVNFDPVVPDGLYDWYNQPVTVTLSAGDESSGMASLEFSLDGVSWNPYNTPLIFGANTPGIPLQVRAVDQAGNLSEMITTTIKIDQVKPTIRGADGQRLHYGSVEILPNGNAQLVLGGVLTDALSGRNTVMLKGGENGLWNPADEIGVFPVSTLPVPNVITPTIPELNWLYRPSFDVRGVYPLTAYGVDMAGNQSAPRSDIYGYLIGTFWWEPDSTPDLKESRVSTSPSLANPGDTVEFTVAARNTGFQESLVVVTDTLPAGVTVLPGSISEGGTYDPDTGQVVWHLGALWPGETLYLHFSASLASGLAAGELDNQVDLEGYWDWTGAQGIIPEPEHHFFSTSNTLTVLPTGDTAGGPRLFTTKLFEGSLVSQPGVSLLMNTSPDARSFYIQEWTWNGLTSRWDLAQESGWTPLENAANLSLEQDSQGKYARCSWVLDAQEGVHYLGVWVADQAGRISNLNEGNLIYTNLVSPAARSLAAGEKVQYRLPMEQNNLAVFNLVVTQGAANIYAWNPRRSFHPDYYNTAQDFGGIKVETLAFYAPETGVYIVEIQATEDTTYQLVAAAQGRLAGLSARAQEILQISAQTPAEAAQQLMEKAAQSRNPQAPEELNLPANPATFSTPWEMLTTPGQPPIVYSPRYFYLPLVGK